METVNSVPVSAASPTGVYLYQYINYEGNWVRIDNSNNVYNSMDFKCRD